MPLTSTRVDQFNALLPQAFDSIAQENWSLAFEQFSSLEKLVDNLGESPSLKEGLCYIIFLFKVMAQFKKGEKNEAIKAFLGRVGVIYYAESGLVGAKHPMTIPLLMAKKLADSLLTHSGLKIPEKVPGKLEAYFGDLRKALQAYYAATKKQMATYLSPLLSHDGLFIPSYQAFALAASDVYQRDTTTANSKRTDCPLKKEAASSTTLQSQQWEMLYTARDTTTYQADEYFGKAYVKDDGKGHVTVIIAHKGTTFNNYNDWRKANFDIGKRRWPAVYYQQAKAFLEYVQKQVSLKYPRAEVSYYMTGHSLGAALSELLSYETQIPSVTFDSPGVQEIITNRDGASVDCQAIPVTGIVSQMNVVNSVNGHVGRLLRIPGDWFTAQAIAKAFQFGLPMLLTEATKASLKTLLSQFLKPETVTGLSQDLEAVFRDVASHSLANFKDFLAKRLDFSVVLQWPQGIQDGATVADDSSERANFIALSYFPIEMQQVFERAATILQKVDFSDCPAMKEILQHVKLVDRFGGEVEKKDHLLITGALTVNELRLFLWPYFSDKRFEKIKQKLLDAIPVATASQSQSPSVLFASPKPAATATSSSSDTASAVTKSGDSNFWPLVALAGVAVFVLYAILKGGSSSEEEAPNGQHFPK